MKLKKNSELGQVRHLIEYFKRISNETRKYIMKIKIEINAIYCKKQRAIKAKN